MNYFVIDTEYSSFYSPERIKSGELLQLSIVPVVDGVPDKKNAFNEYIRPMKKIWSKHSEKVHGITRKRAETFPTPKEVAERFKEWLEAKNNVYTCMGYNCSGDKRYMERFVSDHDIIKDWFTRVRPKWLDVKDTCTRRKKMISKKSFTLSSMCEYFNIEIKAHDALSDAYATFGVYEAAKAIEDPTEGRQKYLDSQLTEMEKREKYLDIKYIMFNGDGDLFITKHATESPEALRIVLAEIWDLYVESKE